MTPKEYITQITAEDMRELSRVTNLKPGFLINIQSDGDSITIGIDKSALALAINGFIRNGGAQASAQDCTEIPFNPPS